MKKYWIFVASKNHVENGIKQCIAQACHGKAQPLKRMQVGDGVIYYSPKMEFGGKEPCQQFTAIGHVVGDEVYPFDMGDGFIPNRRDVKYLKATPASILPLINDLTFIKDKKHWGYIFRFGALQIPAEDFQLIANAMKCRV